MKPKWKHGSTRDYQVNHPNNLAKPFAAGQNFMRSPCHLKFASTSDNQAAHNPFESLELNGDQLSRIEVPPPLTVQQYLDISESRPE